MGCGWGVCVCGGGGTWNGRRKAGLQQTGWRGVRGGGGPHKNKRRGDAHTQDCRIWGVPGGGGETANHNQNPEVDGRDTHPGHLPVIHEPLGHQRLGQETVPRCRAGHNRSLEGCTTPTKQGDGHILCNCHRGRQGDHRDAIVGCGDGRNVHHKSPGADLVVLQHRMDDRRRVCTLARRPHKQAKGGRVGSRACA